MSLGRFACGAASHCCVMVTPEWLEDAEPNIARLVKVLNGRKIRKAVLVLPNGASGGIVDVAAGQASGVPQHAAR